MMITTMHGVWCNGQHVLISLAWPGFDNLPRKFSSLIITLGEDDDSDDHNNDSNDENDNDNDDNKNDDIINILREQILYMKQEICHKNELITKLMIQLMTKANHTNENQCNDDTDICDIVGVAMYFVFRDLLEAIL